MLGNRRIVYQIMIQAGLLLAWLLTSPGYQAKDQAQSGEVTRNDLIRAMNQLRVSRGLPPLIEHPTVNSVAQATAEIMAANYMSWHIGDVRGRIQAAGYGGGDKVWATENFAVGYNHGIDEIMQATGWKPHSCRAFLTGVRKSDGGLVKEERPDGKTAYRIASDAMAAS